MRINIKDTGKGHLLALITAFIWGLTFVSTKVLLTGLHPMMILFLRFLIALIGLFLIHPKVLKWQGWRQEIRFMVAGLTGVTLYFFGETTALTYTYASNVSLITAIIPLLTAIACAILYKERDNMTWGFFTGCAITIVGIGLISFNGVKLQLNPLGDLLSLGASIMWVIYSLIYRGYKASPYTTIEITKRMFIYSLISMLPLLFILPINFHLSDLATPKILGNLLFLGILASGVGYITWNKAMQYLGAVQASVYLYLPPVITVLASVWVLNEQITLLSGTGVILTLAGLMISQNHQRVMQGIKNIFHCR